jgi:hypothetical protein
LAVLDDLCAGVRKAVSDEGPVESGYPSFDRAILNRGLNLLEAIRVLAVPLHWEVAASSARQMFELVLNMESLAAMDDREQASLRYALFGMLQQTKAQIVQLDYGRASGREVDEDRAAALAGFLAETHFDAFRGKPRADGTPAWAKSWNGSSTWDMAKASPSAMRVEQYNQLYVSWSEETHAAPGALIDSMFRTIGPGWIEDHLTNELREMSQIIVMTIHHFLELWMVLVNVPPVDHEAWKGYFAGLNAYTASAWGVSADPHEYGIN